MDLLSPNSTTNSPLTPVFGDNVQDLLGRSALNVNPSAIITVNSIADAVDDPNSGVTTLRDAINQANASNGDSMIVFDRSLFSTAQTITLSGTELDITHNLDIIAPRDSLTGADLVTVSGNKASRVFEVESGATVSIDGLIVADGSSVTGGNGGGIYNSGTLTLDSSIVLNNSTRVFTSPFGFYPPAGGGIDSSGNLTVINSTISGNSAVGSGGGINSSNSTVNNSTINGNSAQYGGGISNRSIFNNSGNSTVNNSTISGNSAQYGGGIYNNSGNSTVNNSTFNVRNTIIASNLLNKNGVNSDVSGTFSSNGYNLIGDSTGSTGFGATGDIVGTSDNPIDPRLATLDFNGGTTQTIALLPDSPAIGAADPSRK